MGARAMFDEAKHPRGAHGKFGSGGGVVQRSRTLRDPLMEGRGVGAYTPRQARPASAERARKVKIKQAVEVPRGIRPPANFSEQQTLMYASPRKLAESRARGEGGMRPRTGPEGALHTQRWAAGGFRTNRLATGSTYQTFTGKRRRTNSSADTPRRGEKLTALGRWHKAKGM